MSAESLRTSLVPNLEAGEPQLIHDPDRLWTVVHAKSRCEKKVAITCIKLFYNFYLPLGRHTKKYQRRTVETHVPLFRGYLFAQLSPEERMHLGRFQNVARIFQIDEEKERGLLDELRSVRIFELANLVGRLEVHPELKPGTPVTITTGPFRGATGIVERRSTHTRLTVNIELLNQSVAVELDVTDLETA